MTSVFGRTLEEELNLNTIFESAKEGHVAGVIQSALKVFGDAKGASDHCEHESGIWRRESEYQMEMGGDVSMEVALCRTYHLAKKALRRWQDEWELERITLKTKETYSGD